MATGLSLFLASRRAAATTAQLHSAERELEALTYRQPPSGTLDRAAVAWGYAERMRLGLESPFRLIEFASRDPRLTLDERRTVSWALLATLLRGESHQVEAASLDRLMRGASVRGETHLALIESSVRRAGDPRAAELALRLGYTLAAAERLVEASAPQIVAQTAALVADREIARREAGELLRDTRASSAIAAIAQARQRHSFYVERPALMAPTAALEHEAIEMAPEILAALRTLRDSAADDEGTLGGETTFREALWSAGSRLPPSSEITVTAKRFLPAFRAEPRDSRVSRLASARNTEMLAAVLAGSWSRETRQALGRLQLSAGVAMRAYAQEPTWFPGGAVPTAAQLGVASVDFDGDVPRAWRPFYVASLGTSLARLRAVFPQLKVDGVHVRFRVSTPADSALAMHEPRTRTLHLPVATAAGTLTHELAHDLDRQVAMQQGRAGYWSDAATRGLDGGTRGAASRVAASLRTMSEEIAGGWRERTVNDRPAEIFATRVDWFVAQALARRGLSSGFLSAVQDEMLTGHVLHPERLRGASRSRSLITALEGMTTVAPFARVEVAPSAYAMTQYVLRVPLERRGHRDAAAFAMPAECTGAREPARLLRLAVESRARGIVRGRAEAIPSDRRPTWARAALAEAPWSPEIAEERVRSVAADLLSQLTTPGLQQGGVGSRVDALLSGARCAD